MQIYDLWVYNAITNFFKIYVYHILSNSSKYSDPDKLIVIQTELSDIFLK